MSITAYNDTNRTYPLGWMSFLFSLPNTVSVLWLGCYFSLLELCFLGADNTRQLQDMKKMKALQLN